jgi:hypothetical protein
MSVPSDRPQRGPPSTWEFIRRIAGKGGSISGTRSDHNRVSGQKRICGSVLALAKQLEQQGEQVDEIEIQG